MLTIAVRRTGYSLNPVKTVNEPVPPPITTIRGCVIAGVNCTASYHRLFQDRGRNTSAARVLKRNTTSRGWDVVTGAGFALSDHGANQHATSEYSCGIH